MTFEQAIALATELNRSPHTVVAVGRFLPPAEVRQDSPWGVSVRCAGEHRSTVVWSPADAARLSGKREWIAQPVHGRGALPMSNTPSPVAASVGASSSASNRPDQRHVIQPTLF